MFHSSSFQTVSSARIARFGSGGTILRSTHAPLDLDQMRKAAPSIFAEDKHDSRSDKYTYIPTVEVLRGMRENGFLPYEVRQGGSRDAEKRAFTKHMIRFRPEGARMIGDSFREVVLINSHDGTSSYQLMSGVFRLVCSNGLVVADGQAQICRIPHKGDIVGDVIDAAYTIIEDGKRVDSVIEDMRLLSLKPEEQEAFAAAAAELKWTPDEETGNPSIPFEPRLLNAPRRRDDVDKPDLWHTFNRVQENLMHGGVPYVQRDERGRRVARRSTRPVNGIDENVKLNRALWVLASRMQELKAA